MGEETCHITRRHRGEGPIAEKDHFWYEAVVVDPDGERVIARSNEWLHESQGELELDDPGAVHRRNEQRQADTRAEIVAVLVADGWHPATFNEKGLPVSFHRSLPEPRLREPGQRDTLLKALDELLQAGLLTQAEFAAKKAQLEQRIA